jgi:hypothetical protein
MVHDADVPAQAWILDAPATARLTPRDTLARDP